MTKKQQGGFAILETMVSVSLFVMAMLLVSEIYSSVQKIYHVGVDKAEVSQNGRVAVDRMSRELRQAVEIVTLLPIAAASATSTIEFQDGHDQSTISYISYAVDNHNLYRSEKYYYFPGDPVTRVGWDIMGPGGILPSATTTSSVIIGEYFDELSFWKSGSLINLGVGIKKSTVQFNIETAIFKRN